VDRRTERAGSGDALDLSIVLILATLFLAFANGANDNVKGAATLLGTGTLSLRGALAFATAATFAGSVSAVLLAERLMRSFTGKGLVPDEAIGLVFLGAVGIGAAATVLGATLIGMPISTTHGLTGGLVGAGAAASAAGVDLWVLGEVFVLPLVAGPLAGAALALGVYPLLRYARKRLGVERKTCICLEATGEHVPVDALAIRYPGVDVTTGSMGACVERYEGRAFGISAQTLLDRFHLLTAAAVSFARGLNDTPKIVALLAGGHLVIVGWGSVMVGAAMAAGGLLAARRVALTMSFDITRMNHGQRGDGTPGHRGDPAWSACFNNPRVMRIALRDWSRYRAGEMVDGRYDPARLAADAARRCRRFVDCLSSVELIP